MAMYAKAVVALVLSVITAVVAAVGNGDLGDLDTNGWVKVALVVLGGTAATWFAENGAGAPVIKAVLGAATAALAAWSVAYENDGVITQGEWLTVVAAGLGALTLVYQIKNKTA